MINYASKFSSKVDEQITIDAYTGKNLNKDYDWDGVDTIKVYSIETAPINFYKRSGTSRFGTPDDLGDTIQTMKIAQDISFTFVIDKGDNSETMMIRNSAKALKRQTQEVMVPYIDKYRYAIMCEEVKSENTDTTTLTKSNVYEKFLAGTEKLAIKGITSGIIAWMKPSAFNLLKQDTAFIKAGDLSQKMLVKGQLGEVDGVAVVPVGGNRLPNGVDFIMYGARCMLSPTKLKDYRIQKDPMGVSGDVVEGRLLFDAFILKNKSWGLYVQGARTSALVATSNAGYKLKVAGIDVYRDEHVYYKVASTSITASTIGNAFTTTGYTEAKDSDNLPVLGTEITGSSTNKYAEVVVVDRNGKVRDAKAFTLEA